MSTNLKLQTAIHLGLGLSIGALAATYAPLAVAQDQSEQDQDDLLVEEVIVTGSRIARADIDSASPITVISQEDMAVTGLTDVGDLLQRMPSMSGSPIGTTTNNGGNGAVLVDLRGMGTDRTLTLINGQRMVDGGDYQTIPANMIERVEILKDGASAVYGADAVAGVVNIITRRDFEGVEFTLQTADWADSAGKQDSVGVIAGSAFDSGNIVFGVEFVNQEEAYQSDTPWEFLYDTFYIYPEGCELGNLYAPYPEGCFRGGSSAIPEGRLRFLNQGLFLIGTPASQPYEVGQMIPHDGRNYNYAPVNYLQTPYERTNLFMEGHFDVTDNIRFNAEIRGNYRESAQELAPTPYFHVFGSFDPAWSGIFDGAPVTGISPDNYYLRRAVDDYNARTGSSLVYEPVVDLRRRMFERPRRFEQEINQYQFFAGFEGSFGDSYDWEVFMNRGYRSRTDQDFGQFIGSRLQNALGPSADLNGDGVPECYLDINDPATLISGCVPLNMFGGGQVVRETGEAVTGTVTDDMFDYLSTPLTDFYKTQHTIYGASITGSNFELPGGALGWAVGYQYWKQEYKYSPDSGKVSGAVTGNTGAGTEGSLTNDGIYLEFLAPVWDNGTQNFYVKGGIRYDDYDAFDGDWTWQLGLEFQALDDLKLRGTYGTVFRAPTITDLYGGIIDSFPTFTDPCDPAAGGPAAGCDRASPSDEGQALAQIGGNPFLQPESGDTYTVGLVWTPQFGDHSLTTTVDYWDIQIEDGISSLGVQFILDDCYIRQNASSCQLVSRREADYGINYILDTQLNVAEQGAKGIDTEIRWNYPSNIGDWQAALLWSHLLERNKKASPISDTVDFSGRYVDPTQEDGGAYAQDKINGSLQWRMGDLSLGWLVEYISGLDADTFTGTGYIQDIDSEMYHDLVASYTFGDWGLNGLTVSGGVTNVTDEPPPFIEVGFNAGTDPATYRLFGRGYYLRLGWKF